MKHIWSSAKYITFTYYGAPVDHVSVSLDVDESVDERARLLLIENAKHKLASYPIETFPVAGSHASLLSKYFERHPELRQELKPKKERT